MSQICHFTRLSVKHNFIFASNLVHEKNLQYGTYVLTTTINTGKVLV